MDVILQIPIATLGCVGAGELLRTGAYDPLREQWVGNCQILTRLVCRYSPVVRVLWSCVQPIVAVALAMGSTITGDLFVKPQKEQPVCEAK